MLQMAPDYERLTLPQKVEVFSFALENTHGQDLYKVLWLKSRNSEVWLDRRTNYTRSLAVMSMVSYPVSSWRLTWRLTWGLTWGLTEDSQEDSHGDKLPRPISPRRSKHQLPLTSERQLPTATHFQAQTAALLSQQVGYILGLGDRHPSNLMLDRLSGKIVHIDFGDCFEVAMHREKFPERIPFRLTRMLVTAMEVSGVQAPTATLTRPLPLSHAGQWH